MVSFHFPKGLYWVWFVCPNCSEPVIWVYWILKKRIKKKR